jgi:F-type H+-transporting ATPase subunit b
VRSRIRVLTAALGIAALVVLLGAPAFAAEGSETQGEGGETPAAGQHEFADEEAEHCFEVLEKGGTVDECQEAPSPLMPEVNEIIWGSLAFAVLFVAMWKFGVPAVRNMEQAREERIRNDLESAERARAEAEAEKARYEGQLADARNEAGRIIDEARQSAETVRRDLIARAEQEANEIRERAQADIANQRVQAMAQLRDEVAQLSIDLAGRIVERNLDNDTNRQLVESFIEQAARSN